MEEVSAKYDKLHAVMLQQPHEPNETLSCIEVFHPIKNEWVQLRSAQDVITHEIDFATATRFRPVWVRAPAISNNVNVMSGFDIQALSFETLYKQYLEPEARLSPWRKFLACCRLTFCRCAPISRDPGGCKEHILAVLGAWVDNYMIITFLLSLGAWESMDSTKDRIPAIMSIAQLVIRILLTVRRMRFAPLIHFATLPLINLVASITVTGASYNDLSASFTKEYDGYVFYMSQTIAGLISIPFGIVSVVLVWIADEPDVQVFSFYFDLAKIGGIIGLIYSIISMFRNFFTSMAYHRLGCERYADFDDVVRQL